MGVPQGMSSMLGGGLGAIAGNLAQYYMGLKDDPLTRGQKAVGARMAAPGNVGQAMGSVGQMVPPVDPISMGAKAGLTLGGQLIGMALEPNDRAPQPMQPMQFADRKRFTPFSSGGIT